MLSSITSAMNVVGARELWVPRKIGPSGLLQLFNIHAAFPDKFTQPRAGDRSLKHTVTIAILSLAVGTRLSLLVKEWVALRGRRRGRLRGRLHNDLSQIASLSTSLSTSLRVLNAL